VSFAQKDAELPGRRFPGGSVSKKDTMPCPFLLIESFQRIHDFLGISGFGGAI
jgi:hypothetical protein